MAGRQNYTQRNRGTGSRTMWLERNLGRSGRKAEGRWDPEGKCYLAQKQSCAYEEKAGRIWKENNQN